MMVQRRVRPEGAAVRASEWKEYINMYIKQGKINRRKKTELKKIQTVFIKKIAARFCIERRSV